jgi:hypothetical protein
MASLRCVAGGSCDVFAGRIVEFPAALVLDARDPATTTVGHVIDRVLQEWPQELRNERFCPTNYNAVFVKAGRPLGRDAKVAVDLPSLLAPTAPSSGSGEAMEPAPASPATGAPAPLVHMFFRPKPAPAAGSGGPSGAASGNTTGASPTRAAAPAASASVRGGSGGRTADVDSSRDAEHAKCCVIM